MTAKNYFYENPHTPSLQQQLTAGRLCSRFQHYKDQQIVATQHQHILNTPHTLWNAVPSRDNSIHVGAMLQTL